MMIPIDKIMSQCSNWRDAEPNHIEFEINGKTVRIRANEWNFWATMPGEYCDKARERIIREYSFLLPLDSTN